MTNEERDLLHMTAAKKEMQKIMGEVEEAIDNEDWYSETTKHLAEYFYTNYMKVKDDHVLTDLEVIAIIEKLKEAL